MCFICDKLDLKPGDVIEFDTVESQVIAENYDIRSRTRAVLLPNDDYFKHIPEMVVNDPKHLVVVTSKNEPLGVKALYDKRVTWRKVGRVAPRLK